MVNTAYTRWHLFTDSRPRRQNLPPPLPCGFAAGLKLRAPFCMLSFPAREQLKLGPQKFAAKQAIINYQMYHLLPLCTFTPQNCYRVQSTFF